MTFDVEESLLIILLKWLRLWTDQSCYLFRIRI